MTPMEMRNIVVCLIPHKGISCNWKGDPRSRTRDVDTTKNEEIKKAAEILMF